MTRPGVQARRDAVLAAVRDGGVVSTQEICRRLCDRCRASARPATYHCYSRVYNDLRALERAGRVVWHEWSVDQPTRWSLPSAAASDATEVDLEALWASS